MYQYEHQLGKVRRNRDGSLMLRPKGTRPPCRYGFGQCHKGTPEDQKGLSKKNLLAYQHYIECKATGDFPKDAIVRKNAGIIRIIEDSVAAQNAERLAILTRL